MTSLVAQIDRPDYDHLKALIQKASGYTKKEFANGPLANAQRKMLKWVQGASEEKRAANEAEDKYTLPAGITVEQHLFNLTFKDSNRPIRVLDHAFREYDPTYGYWKLIPDEELEQRVLNNCELAHYPAGKNGPGRSLATAANVNKAMQFAGKKLFTAEQAVNRHLMAFRNVTVCTKTGVAREHSPDNLITTALPYEYKPNADCPPAMQRYIASSFGSEHTEYVRAALGLILDLTAPDKFVHAIGPSGSGKGVFTRLVMKFFGSEVVGSPNNFKIFSNPDQIHQYLSGKRLLCIDDIVGFVGEEIGSFYTAVERTAMNARCLFKPKGYTQQFNARYTVASVGQLATRFSNSKGWERRVFPLPTTGRQSEDPSLEVDLENEIADIISWALAQDKAVRNDILRHPGRYNDKAEAYFWEAAHSSSSAWAFIDQCLKPVAPHSTDTSDSQALDEGKLYGAYKAYCVATGRQPMALDGLKHELRQALPLNWTERRQGGKVPRRFVYIQFVPGLFDWSEFGNCSCNLSSLGYDGGLDFRDWAKDYGVYHPFIEADLIELAKTENGGVQAEVIPSPVEPVTPVAEASEPTPVVEAVPVPAVAPEVPFNVGDKVQAVYRGKTPREINEAESYGGIPRASIGIVTKVFHDGDGWIAAVDVDGMTYADPVGVFERVLQ